CPGSVFPARSQPSSRDHEQPPQPRHRPDQPRRVDAEVSAEIGGDPMKIYRLFNVKDNRLGSLLLLFFLAPLSPALGGAPAADSLRKDSAGFTLKSSAGILRLQVWSDRIVRVTRTRADSLGPDNSLSVIAKPAPAQWDILETG